MRCPRCGSSVSDAESFCPYCGEQMTDDVIAKSNKPLLIAMSAIVLALLVVTFLAFTGKFTPHDDEPEYAAAAMTPEEAAEIAAPAASPAASPAAESTAEPTLTPQPTSPPEPTPSPSPSPTSAAGGTYILPDSDSRMLTEADLENLGERELMLARNEIFARHGFIFTTQWIQGYFLTQGWYRGTTPANQFDSSVFNSYERANVDLILRIEAERAG